MGLFIRDDAVRGDLKERDRRIRESWARVDVMPRQDYGDEEMYDEFGSPR